jgi:hypothetical protein
LSRPLSQRLKTPRRSGRDLEQAWSKYKSIQGSGVKSQKIGGPPKAIPTGQAQSTLPKQGLSSWEYSKFFK